MKISEVAVTSDKQFLENLSQSIELSLRTVGNKVLSKAGFEDATEEALVLETISAIYKGFIAKSKAAGMQNPSYEILASYLRSSGISDSTVQSTFKTLVDVPPGGDSPEPGGEETGNTPIDQEIDGGQYNDKGIVDTKRLQSDKKYRDYIMRIISRLNKAKGHGPDPKGTGGFGLNVRNLKFRGGFKIGDQVLFTKDLTDKQKQQDVANKTTTKGPVLNGVIIGRDAQRNDHFRVITAKNRLGFSIPQDRLTKAQGQGKPVTAPSWTNLQKFKGESIIREFEYADPIPVDKIKSTIEKAVRTEYGKTGLRNVVIPDALGEPSERTQQLLIKINQEMQNQVKDLDKDGDGEIDNTTNKGPNDTQPGGGNTPTPGEEQPTGDTPTPDEELPQIDIEKINAVLQQIFKMSGPEKNELVKALAARNKQIDAKTVATNQEIQKQKNRQSTSSEPETPEGQPEAQPKPQKKQNKRAKGLKKNKQKTQGPIDQGLDAIDQGKTGADFISGN